jgi:predicted nucleic acid-binding protein
LIAYLDTSSLIKLYVDEAGADAVRNLVREASIVATSAATNVEMRASLAAWRRDRRLTPPAYSSTRAAFAHDWTRLVAVEVNDDVIRAAGDLAERHRLRTLDAIHLASFVQILERAGIEEVRFSSFDERLNRAARTLG